ncbi:guanylate kinase, putative [Entamoeba invadens IP1]|uniref:guanylate kinase n=1 Tax=Entamoeba invadens IP1 TaxID=370355 RepID=A0A0A1U2R9_ENTIV|nr:guanylate kinase, putative [Entamoeba invadens IP1]ELP86958.1 guanylate kinase, putative [Entamoeba invadens IP1]|eukprot:XP_004253729.1 guanylate kinase, putative [Entamoeba invadens IP1]
MSGKHQVLVILGPSGVGKSTLVSHLMEQFPNKFSFSVSHTTRKPRGKERDGVEYNFITEEKMKEMINNNEFVEHAHVHTAFYGTSLQEIKRINANHQIAILDIDVQGSKQVRGKVDAFYLFVAPPSMEVLEQRLRGRNTETEEQIKVRLANAIKEMEGEKDADYVIVNTTREATFPELDKVILQHFDV